MVNRSEPSDATRQAMSSLMDGELSAGDAGDACAQWQADAQARGHWHAYHLIGDVMRSDDLASTSGHDAQFLQSLRARLASEPVPLAPSPLQAGPAALANGWQPSRRASASGRASRSRHWLMAPAAVAAGFMAVAGVMVVTQVWSPGPKGGQTLASAVGAPTTAPTASTTLVRDARLDRYLSAHRSQANGVAAASAGAEHRVHIVFEGQ